LVPAPFGDARAQSSPGESSGAKNVEQHFGAVVIAFDDH
jgi:hypothetical protein